MWKPGQLITIKRKVYRVHQFESQWYPPFFPGRSENQHPCSCCDLHETTDCLLYRPLEQTCLFMLGSRGYLKRLKKHDEDEQK